MNLILSPMPVQVHVCCYHCTRFFSNLTFCFLLPTKPAITLCLPALLLLASFWNHYCSYRYSYMFLSWIPFPFSQIILDVSPLHTFAFCCILCDSVNKERYSLGKTEPVFLRSIPYLLINVVLKKNFILRFCCPFYSVLFYNNIVSHSFHLLQVLHISPTSRVTEVLVYFPSLSSHLAI